MRSNLENLKTLLNNSIHRYGIEHPRTLLIAARVDEEVTKIQKGMMK